MQKIHISIEGNIGVGKSTLLSNIYKHFKKMRKFFVLGNHCMNGTIMDSWETCIRKE